MKPTEEIIKLAKKLHELGYRQEIKIGDWVFAFEFTGSHLVRWANKTLVQLHEIGHYPVEECIPIPSLEDGLMWLKEHSNTKGIQWAVMLLNNVSTNNRWSCHFNPDIGKYCEADTPHEAVLKAMVKILEGG